MAQEREKPLMLKDYLELDESSSVGFQCYPRRLPPTMRNLLDAELRGGSRLVRTQSKSTLKRISSVIRFTLVKQEGFLSRSLSRKLKGSFWKRRFGQGQSGKIKFEEEMERKFFCYPSPVVSSFRSWLEMDNGNGFGFGSEFVSAESPARKEMISDVKQEDDQKMKERESTEQLSPVSVMDFPFDEEEEDDVATATTSSHYSSTIHSDRSKLHILQKSRRFDEIANLDPINLEEQFTVSESNIHTTSEEKLSDLLEQLGPIELFQKLLEDFFTDCLSENTEKTKLLNEATNWLYGEGQIWELQGRRGEMELTEMERIRKWRVSDEERMEISIDLESMVFESLVGDLVDELLE